MKKIITLLSIVLLAFQHSNAQQAGDSENPVVPKTTYIGTNLLINSSSDDSFTPIKLGVDIGIITDENRSTFGTKLLISNFIEDYEINNLELGLYYNKSFKIAEKLFFGTKAMYSKLIILEGGVSKTPNDFILEGSFEYRPNNTLSINASIGGLLYRTYSGDRFFLINLFNTTPTLRVGWYL